MFKITKAKHRLTQILVTIIQVHRGVWKCEMLKYSVVVASYSKFKTVITLVVTLTQVVRKCIFDHTHTIKMNRLTANLGGGISMGMLTVL